MALMDFIKKQFIGILAWRFPMADHEIQCGASLTVRESQLAQLENRGKAAADHFGLGCSSACSTSTRATAATAAPAA